MAEAAPAAAASASADDSSLADKHKESEAAIKGTAALRAKGAAHEDPAEAAYMKSLIGDADVQREDGRRVVITEFRIVRQGDAEDTVYDLSTPELVKQCKAKPFKVLNLSFCTINSTQHAHTHPVLYLQLIEATNWKLQLKFGCYGKELVAGLQFLTIIKKSLFTVTEKFTIGSFAPNGKVNLLRAQIFTN